MESCSLARSTHPQAPIAVSSVNSPSWSMVCRSHSFNRVASSAHHVGREVGKATIGMEFRSLGVGRLGICSELRSSIKPWGMGWANHETQVSGRERRKFMSGRVSSGRGAVMLVASSQGDAGKKKSKAEQLRDVLAAPGIHQGPACHDALSARLVEMAGFEFAFMSGFAVSAARLGLPDTGLISYGEMVEQGRLIANAVSIPVIGDGDNGYGNAMNVKRTVQGYAQAGFAGILIEDQVSPKACGHTAGRKVLPREEAIMNIRAAVDARNEGPHDILIVARTDARQAVSLEEALWRAHAFAEAGADVLFVDALASKQEMLDFCKTAPSVPKMANMLEGGGRTPILSPDELADIGFKIVAYPLSLIGVSIRAMQDALAALRSGRLPPPSLLPTFDEVKSVVGFSKYYAEETRYAVTPPPTPSPISADRRLRDDPPPQKEKETSASSKPLVGEADRQQDRAPQASSSLFNQLDGGAVSRSAGGGAAQPPPSSPRTFISGEGEVEVVEADAIREEEEEPGQSQSQRFSPPGTGSESARASARSLRLKVTDSNGSVKIDAVVPAGFIDGVATIIPGVAGLNLRALLEDTSEGRSDEGKGGRTILDIRDNEGDRIQIMLE